MLSSFTKWLQVFVVHLVESWRFFLSRVESSGPDYLRIGLQLLIKDSKRTSDHSLNKHPNQNSFGRPIGEGSIDLAQVFDRTALLFFSVFFNHPFLYRE